jgi:hypothetical protein
MNLQNTNNGANSNESANTQISPALLELKKLVLLGWKFKHIGLVIIAFAVYPVFAAEPLSDDYFSKQEEVRQTELKAFYESEMARILDSGGSIYCQDRINDLKKKVPVPTDKIEYLQTDEGCEAEMTQVLLGK